ncbi:hypothetical protein [Terriglobus saanensis]|uniref:Uncharacterized protein n=1 Tax=Terriglobus saanensis (strain ATCC BAA-1853 / DSM 23119 / SP1PR4) TaxID=401053 RepID=E8UXY6_TERSS|nr:hypothetical protein [Terriglobus saanensis]ADV84220.1 hypothetical protein AciPR4_3466 [Terriglobus saanensis SP1PR4]
MSDQDLKKTVKAMKSLQEVHEASPAKALAFLVKAGIATKTGKLAKPYKQIA